MTTTPPEIAWPAILTVAAITLSALALQWWLKRRGLIPTASANPIKVIATRSLGGKRSLAVIEVETQRFLLGLTDDAVSCLATLPSEAKAIGLGTVATLPTAVNG